MAEIPNSTPSNTSQGKGNPRGRGGRGTRGKRGRRGGRGGGYDPTKLHGALYLRTWNVEKRLVGGTVLWSPNNRLESVEMPTFNYGGDQPDFWTKVKNKYIQIIKESQEKKTPNVGLNPFICWEIDPNRRIKGIQRDLGREYFKVSIEGRYMDCHIVVWCFHNPGIDSRGLDISHLCGHSFCVRPTHLFAEPHPDNMRRRSCLGFVWINGLVKKVCTHDPACKVFTDFGALESINFEQLHELNESLPHE